MPHLWPSVWGSSVLSAMNSSSYARVVCQKKCCVRGFTFLVVFTQAYDVWKSCVGCLSAITSYAKTKCTVRSTSYTRHVFLFFRRNTTTQKYIFHVVGKTGLLDGSSFMCYDGLWRAVIFILFSKRLRQLIRIISNGQQFFKRPKKRSEGAPINIYVYAECQSYP